MPPICILILSQNLQTCFEKPQHKAQQIHAPKSLSDVYFATGCYRLVKQMCPNFAFRNIFTPSARLDSMFYPSALKATLPRGYRHLTPTASQMQIQYPFYYTTGYYRLVKQMCPNFAFRNIFAPSARLYSMFYPSALKATLHPWLSTFDTYGVANNFIPCLSPYGKYIRVL